VRCEVDVCTTACAHLAGRHDHLLAGADVAQHHVEAVALELACGDSGRHTHTPTCIQQGLSSSYTTSEPLKRVEVQTGVLVFGVGVRGPADAPSLMGSLT
jgi:hypothetical protein